jgi:hypothetical protein
MKRLLLIIFLLAMTFTMMAGNVKIVDVPGDVTIEKGAFKETLLRNLCEEEEIYDVMSITVFDDFIYILSAKPIGIYKLDFQGKTIDRAGREGQGPGEFASGINLNKVGNLLVFQDYYNKMLYYTRDLEFVKEIRLPLFSMCFAPYREENFVFSTTRISSPDKLFRVYSPAGKLLRSFGDKGKGYNPKKFSYDYVFDFAYDPVQDSIWAAFGNCYDLLYYKKEKLTTRICEDKDFFREYEVKDEETGRKRNQLTGRPIKIFVVKDKVFYFYKKDDKFYCDIFNKNSFKILRRVKLDRFYRRMAHYKDGIFFCIYYGKKGEEDYQLYRIELK